MKRKEHTFVPGDLVRWKDPSRGFKNELGIVLGSLGGLEEDFNTMWPRDEGWFRVHVFWMTAAARHRFDCHPISALKLVG